MLPTRILRTAQTRFFLAIVALLLAGCWSVPSPPAISTATPSQTRRSSITPTSSFTPIIMCTAPWCWEDEALSCPAECPGGCGVSCATRTPDPLSTPTPPFPPLPGICVFPTPEPGQAEQRFDLCTSALQVRVGETVELAGEMHGGEQVSLIDISGQDVDGEGNFWVRARSGDHLPIPWNNNAHLNVIHIQTHANQIYIILKAQSPGTVRIIFRALPSVPDIQGTITITVGP